MSDQETSTSESSEGSDSAVVNRPASPEDEWVRTEKRPRRLRRRLARLLDEVTGEQPDGSHDSQKLLKTTQLAMRIARLEMRLAKADMKLASQYRGSTSIHAWEFERTWKDAKLRWESASLHLKQLSRLLQMEESLVAKLPEDDDYGVGMSDVVHAMFKDQEGPDRKNKRAIWSVTKAQNYYDGTHIPEWGKSGKTLESWCHIQGSRMSDGEVAHIVPYSLDDGAIPEHLFGEMAHEVDSPANSLLLHPDLKRCFDEYRFVIIPVDPSESPITKRKADVISSAIKDEEKWIERFDGRELKFRNGNRPNARFLYFRFMLTLIRIRDKQMAGWENVWARYRTTNPFGTPGRYCRDGMLMALAVSSKVSDSGEIEACLAELCGPETMPRAVVSEDTVNGMRKEMGLIMKCLETPENKETGGRVDPENWDCGDETDCDEDRGEDRDEDSYEYDNDDELYVSTWGP